MPEYRNRPRVRRRRADAKLNRRQVLAAHKLYASGVPVRVLAEVGWEKWGYASPHIAATRLWTAFKRDGLPVRKWERRNGGVAA